MERNIQARKELDIELFAGAGGLACGLRAAGFRSSFLYEVDQHACATLRANCSHATSTLDSIVIETDVSAISWAGLRDSVRLLAAGAPCQPFSLGGKHGADSDSRNQFPELLRSIRAIKPRAVLIENVRGLLRPDFSPYFTYIKLQLQWPNLRIKSDESWRTHNARLLAHAKTTRSKPTYFVSTACLNAADFGVPQIRHRVFIVAIRGADCAFEFSTPTHSRDALTRTLEDGSYYEIRGLSRPRRTEVKGGSNTEVPAGLKPWVTVRDALCGLRAAVRNPMNAWQNHWTIQGARLYDRHKGSVFDWPSKTIKAGVHGVPGGENVINLDRGRYRYYTLREAARLQTFPDEHLFVGSRTAITRQIGNAVPPLLATAVAKPLLKSLAPSGSSDGNADEPMKHIQGGSAYATVCS